MIIKQEVLLSLLVILLIASSTCDKLTDIENYERVNNCGKQELPMFDGNKEKINFPTEAWLVKVALVKENKMNEEFALGSFISPRHILTSSQPIMDDEERYNWNNEKILTTDYINGTNDTLVPIGSIDNAKIIVTRNVLNDAITSDLPAVKSVWILSVKEQPDIKIMRSPMIIELERNVPDMKYACLTNGSTPEDVGDTVHIYGFTPPNNRTTLDYRNDKIKGLTDDVRWILVKKYTAERDRGGPLLKVINGKSIILGIGGSPPVICSNCYDAPETYFFKMSHFVNEICTYAGICNISPNFQLPSTTTASSVHSTNINSDGETVPTKNEYDDEEVSVEWGEDVFQGNGRNGCNWILIALLVLLKWGIGY